MRIVLFSLFLLFSLAACSGNQEQSSDPKFRRDQANADIAATERAKIDAFATETRQAKQERQQAEKQERELLGPLRASETAIMLSNQQADATTTAAVATATAQAQFATATIQARLVDIEISRRRFDETREKTKAVVMDILMIGGFIALVCFSIYVVNKLSDWFIEWKSWKNSILVVNNGVLKRRGDDWLFIASGTVQNATWGTGERAVISALPANVIVTPKRQPDRSTTGQVLDMIQRAIQAGYGFKDQIPRYDKLDLSSAKWQELTGLLEARGLIETIDSRDANGKPGTYLIEDGPYSCLYELEGALSSGKLVIPPHPANGRSPTSAQAQPAQGAQ